MARNKNMLSPYWRNVITRLTLILASVVIIVWFLPRNSGPQFRYDVKKPWMYSSLIANFDFPIYKTDEAIQAEKDSLTNHFEPYYNYKEDVETEQIARLSNDFKTGIPGVPADYMSVIADRLHRLYQAGIIRTPEYSKIAKDTMNMVRVVSGKTAQTTQISCIYSVIAAYEQLLSDVKLAPYRQALQRSNLVDYIQPNLIYDQERSETERNDMLSSVPIASGMVLAGQKIIDRGEIVDEHTYRVLSSFEREMKRRSASSSTISSTIAGQVIFVAIMMALFTIYLALFRNDYFEKPRSITMLYVMITAFPIVVSIMMEHSIFSVYALPFAMTPIFVRVFMDSRTAFISHVTMVLICAAAVKYQYEFIIIQLVAGLVAIYSLRELSLRAQLFRTAFLVTLSSCVIYFALQLMQDNSILQMDHDMYKYFIVNGVYVLVEEARREAERGELGVERGAEGREVGGGRDRDDADRERAHGVGEVVAPVLDVRAVRGEDLRDAVDAAGRVGAGDGDDVALAGGARGGGPLDAHRDVRGGRGARADVDAGVRLGQGGADGGRERGGVGGRLELGDGGEREDAADDRLAQVGEVGAERVERAGDVAQDADAVGQGGGDEEPGVVVHARG